MVAFVALERMPEDALEPLGRSARLLVSDEGSSPIRAAPLLLGGARAGAVPDALSLTAAIEAGALGRAARVAELRGVLPEGVTAAFELLRVVEEGARPPGTVAAPGASAPAPSAPPARPPPGATAVPSEEPRGGLLRISLRRTSIDRGVPALEGAVEVERPDAAAEGAAEGPRRELVVSEPWPLKGRCDFAIIFPCALPGEEARAIAALGSVAPAPSPEGIASSAHRAALAACRSDLARDAARLREPPSARPVAGTALPDLETARRTLSDEKARRRALFSIAQATGARLAEDVALSGAEPVVATISAAVAAALAGAPGGGAREVAGWLVERAAIRSLLARSRASEDVTPADLFLLRRMGAVAWAEDAAEAALRGAGDLADFERRLLESNRALLDDGLPALRARALEWLEERGAAPSGFDPLGPPAERRAALERAGILPPGGGS